MTPEKGLTSAIKRHSRRLDAIFKTHEGKALLSDFQKRVQEMVADTSES